MSARLILAFVAVVADVAACAAAADGAGTAPSSSEPVFVPGFYQVETRNSRSRQLGVARRCLRSADADAFQRETLAAFLREPQFRAVCKLSEPKRSPDGFAAAMDCGGARTIFIYRFADNLVVLATRTSVVDRPESSSSELTLMRRLGDCPDKPSGHDR